MKPIELAALVYGTEPCARTFTEDLEAHLLHGLVFSTPESFIMARYVSRSWRAEDIVNPWVNPPGEKDLDCIHVYLASGDITDFFTFAHRSCKWVSFERTNRLKFYEYSKILKRCTKNSQVLIGVPI